MILIVCESCSFCMRVMGNPEEVDNLVGKDSIYWPDKYICPRCEKGAVCLREILTDPVSVGRLDIVDLIPQEAFAALNGLGLPSEADCTADILRKLLREQPVRRLAATDLRGTKRCRVEHLELWDGTKVYFGAGAEGAVVYRIVRPQSYVEKVDGGRASTSG